MGKGRGGKGWSSRSLAALSLLSSAVHSATPLFTPLPFPPSPSLPPQHPLIHCLLPCRMLAEQLCDVDPSVLSDDEKLAFFLNLYNALLLHVSDSRLICM